MPTPTMPRPPIFKPVARSPLHECLAKEGAVFSNRSGWLVADRFGDAREKTGAPRAALALADLSFAGKWDVHGADLVKALGTVSEGALVPEPGRAAIYEGGVICRLASDHALLIFDQ